MALTLDATVGGPSANAYVTIVAAQAIFDGVPNTSAWDNADTDVQAQALVYATTLLDALAYKGVKAAPAQARQWPRGGVVDPDYGTSSDAFTGYAINGGGTWGAYLDMALIPARMQRACSMLALEILRAGTSDVWGVDDSVNIIRERVDVIETEYASPVTRRTGLQRYRNVWREIAPLLQSAAASSVSRA